METGLEVTSYIQCELLRSISRNRLIHRLGIIGDAESLAIAQIIRTLLNY